MTRAVIRSIALEKVFRDGSGPLPVLRGVNLELDQGESIAVVGRSGSGKSTLLHLLGLLDTPTSGRIEIGSDVVTPTTKKDLHRLRSLHIGFVFQQFHLAVHLTALENVMLGLRYADMPRRDRRQTAHAALDSVGLGHRVNAFPGTLSGGEQQRVAVARAIAKRPTMLLCDEPSGNLDAATAVTVLDAIIGARSAVHAVVIVTHDMAVASAADRVLELANGVLQELP